MVRRSLYYHRVIRYRTGRSISNCSQPVILTGRADTWRQATQTDSWLSVRAIIGQNIARQVHRRAAIAWQAHEAACAGTCYGLCIWEHYD
jgi:hypothetical protein